MNENFKTLRLEAAVDAQRKIPFIAEKESREFHEESIRLVIQHYAKSVEQHVPSQNQLLLYHGQTWTFLREERGGEFRPQTGEAQKFSASTKIQIERVIANDVNLIPEFIEQLVTSQLAEFERGVRAQHEEILNEPGNTISVPKNASVAQSYLDFIKNSEPICGINGKPTRVKIFIEPAAQQRLEDELANGGPDFRQQFERQCEALWAEKESAALEKENQRLARYQH
jgi:hypothetical protein